MTTREKEIHERTINLLIDKGTLSKVEPNDIRSFEVLLYQSERLKALGKDPAGRWKTGAMLLSLELNFTEDNFNTI